MGGDFDGLGVHTDPEMERDRNAAREKQIQVEQKKAKRDEVSKDNPDIKNQLVASYMAMVNGIFAGLPEAATCNDFIAACQKDLLVYPADIRLPKTVKGNTKISLISPGDRQKIARNVAELAAKKQARRDV